MTYLILLELGDIFLSGLYLDAQAGLQYLLERRDIDRRKIIVFGRSLGGAVAVHLAASLSNRDR